VLSPPLYSNEMGNMKRFVYTLTLLFSLGSAWLSAQVLSWTPTFPTRHDTITVIYNAAQGNQGLLGEREVYAHTGVITPQSDDDTDWRYVKAGWTENIPDCKMEKVGLNGWRMRFHIESYYNVPADEPIHQLAFVFRNAASSKKGAAEDGSDLFIPVYQAGGFNLALIAPDVDPVFVAENDSFQVQAVASGAESIVLSIDAVEVARTEHDTLSTFIIATAPGAFDVEITATAAGGETQSESFQYLVTGAAPVAELPQGLVPGVNRIDDETAVLVLHAPYKNSVYALGDFTDWKIDPAFLMNRTPDQQHWWIRLDQLTPDRPVRYQFLVDETLFLADPYSETVLDPWHDAEIPAGVYPNLPEYPQGAQQIVSVFDPVKPVFDWTDDGFIRPAQSDLIVYELLIRDFLADHSFASLTDTLDYLQRLGVNAIELMPVSEFEGNVSWGYNTSFHMALDKYYGTAKAFKAFVNAAHARGMAVIMDMVLNHAYGQNPLVRLYWDAANNRPGSANPWFNTTSPNPVFSWGYDFNHQSSYTQAYVDRVLRYWVDEFHVDGYRLDFTKGFTNTPGEGGAYDGQRIAILKRLGDALWSHTPGTYLILEHFAENREERMLAEYGQGFLLWGNMNGAYRQSAMGWLNDSGRSSDLSWGFYGTRGWMRPGLVTYMESHDEPRLMYENLAYGRQAGDYSVQNLETALGRVELASVFFLTLPGPKMIWQFGELGYDAYLAPSGYDRVNPKPIRWEDYEDPARRRLFDVMAALNRLRAEHALFRNTGTNVTLRVGQNQPDRRIHLSGDTLNATVLGNFDVASRSIVPDFQHVGWWYEYFSGDSLLVADVEAELTLAAGAYRLYTDRRLTTPEITSAVAGSAAHPSTWVLDQNYPNPFNPSTVIRFNAPRTQLLQLAVYNVLGQRVRLLVDEVTPAGLREIDWDGRDDHGGNVGSGVFFLRLTAGQTLLTRKMIRLQ